MNMVNCAKKMTNKKKIVNYLKMNYRGFYQINKMIKDSETKKATK
jgi:hypothetical protein